MKMASRQGDYFHRALAVDNTNSAAYPEIMALGVALRAGPGEEDVVMTQTGRLYIAQTPQSFGYDADGNLVNDGRWTYTWDGENRLIAVTENANPPEGLTQRRFEFGYDADGRRVAWRR